MEFTPEQEQAINQAKLLIEQRRRADEKAAELLASTNPPYKPMGFWKRLGRALWRSFR